MEYGLAVMFLGGGIWLKYKPTRAQVWYALAAWCLSNGDAAVERAKARAAHMAEARKLAEVAA